MQGGIFMTKKRISPIALQYQPDLKKTLVTINGKNGIAVVKLTDEELASLYYNVKASYKARKGDIPKETVDAVKGIKPQLKPEKAKTVTISSKLYQEYKELYIKDKKLKMENSLLKKELHQLHQTKTNIFSKLKHRFQKA